MDSDVQSYWEVPCIAHFCSLYRKSFDLLDFDIEELEEALLTDSSDEEIGNSLIQELIVRLLKGCFNSQQKDDITSCNYQMYLRRLFRIKCEEDSSRQNPFSSDIAFHSLPLKNRVELLHDLCNFRLDADVIPESLRVLESDSLRVRPLGRDSGGSTYWYFYGTRLYREDYNTKPKSVPLKKHIRKNRKSETSDTKWEIACTTEEDWQLLTNKFKNCKSKDEKALHERLKEQFLPELPRLFAEREKLMSKRMMDPQPRRSNRAVPTGLLTIPPTPIPPQQKSSSVLFDELQSLKEKEEKEMEAKQGKTSSNTNVHASTSGADKSSDEDDPVNPDSLLSDAERAQRQKEEQEKADRLFAEQLEREERMARLHLRERRFSGAGGSRGRAADAQIMSALSTSSKESKSQTSSKKRPESSSPSRSRSEKRKASGKSKSGKKVKSSRMTNNSLSASLLGDSDNDSDEEGGSGSSDDEGGKYTSSNSDSDGDTKRKNPKKGEISPTKKDIRKKVFSGSSRAKQKGRSITPEKKKSGGGSSKSSKSVSKKSGANNSHFGLGTSKTKVKSSLLFSQNEEDVVIGMHKVIETVKAHRDAWPFVNPVDEEYAPGYFKVVKEPMDIQTMEDKLDNQEYHSVDQFKEDFQKIVDNCRLYNGASSEYTEMVETIEELFNKTFQRVMIQDESDDEDISIEYADAGSGQKKKRKNSTTVNEKSKSKSRSKKSTAQSSEDEETTSKSKPDKAKKEPSSSNKDKEKASSSCKTSVKSKKEQLMRHHSHKSGKDGRKVVSDTAEALKDMNKWLDETGVGAPAKSKKKEKRKRDDGNLSDRSASPSRSRTNSVSRSFKHAAGNAGLPPSSLEFASAFEIAQSPKRKKYILERAPSAPRVHPSSSRDSDDKSKPVKKRHLHHSSEPKKHTSAAEGGTSDNEEKHHHHHHHHKHRHHSVSSADGDVREGTSGQSSHMPPKKRESSSSVSGSKRKKPTSSSSSSPAPSKKSNVKKDTDRVEKMKSPTIPPVGKDATGNAAVKRKGDGVTKSTPKKPLMKRSMSLMQGFKNNANSMKRLQVGKATKFNIKHSLSLTLDEANRDNNNGAGKAELLPPWKRSAGAKALPSSADPNRNVTTAATAEFMKWQQAERGADSRFAWLKNKKDGPKLSLGTVLPKHAINLSGLKYNEASGANGLSDTEQNGSTHEEEEEDEDDEEEDLYSKLERGLANLSRGTLSDKARDLLTSNPALAAKIALNGVDKVREEMAANNEEENRTDDGGSSAAKSGATSEDRKFEPAKGFNAEKSLPNLSAWFKAFGAPGSNSSSGTSTAATTPTTVNSGKEDISSSSPSAPPPAHSITKPKFRVMGRTPGGEKATSSGATKSSGDSSNVKGEKQPSVRGGASSKSPPSSAKEDRKEPEKSRRGPQHRNRKASTSSMSSQSEVGSPAYYSNSGNNQDSGVINPPRWADSNMEHPTWGSQSQSPSASSQVSSQSPAGPNSPFSPAPISSPPETPPRPVGPVRVGFYQDITTNSSSQHSSPEKAGSNESPQNIINVTSPATPPTTTSQAPPKRETSVLKGYPSYAPNYAHRYGVNNSNSPSPSGPATPGTNSNVTSPPSAETRPPPDSPPVNTNKTYTHLESKKPPTSESIPPRVIYDPPRWSPYPPGHPLYHPPSHLSRAHLASAPTSSPHSEIFSPNSSNYNQPDNYGQPEAAHSRNNSRYNPNNMSGGPQAAHSNSQPQAAHQYSSASSSSSSASSPAMSQLLRSGTPLIQSQLPTYTSNPYASNPRNVNIPPNIYNNPIADRIGAGLGMMPMSSSSALTLTNTSSTSSSGGSSGRGRKSHQQQQQSSTESHSGSGKGGADVGNVNGFQWPHPHHPMAGLTQIVNNLPGSMNPYIARSGHHSHYDPEAMAKYARSGSVVDPIGYTNLSAGGSKSASHPHPEMLAKGLVNLSTNSSSQGQGSSTIQSSSSKSNTTSSSGRRGRGEGKKTKAAAAAAAAAAQQQQHQQQQNQQQPIVPGSAFNFSSLSTDLSLYPKDFASSVGSRSSGGSTTPGPSASPYSIPPYMGSHPSYHQSQPSQSSPFGSSSRGMVDPYQQFFPGSPHVLPLLTPTSSYAQAYAAAAAHNPSAHAAAHGLGFTRPGWI